LWRSNGESEAIKQLKKKGITKSKSLKDNTIQEKMLGFIDHKEKRDLGCIIHQKGGGISTRACWNASCTVNADRVKSLQNRVFYWFINVVPRLFSLP
jgi:hypothetical protein